MNEIVQTMWHTWTTGGWVMIAMVVLSLAIYVSGAHLLMSAYRRGLTKVTDDHLRDWVAKPDRAPKHSRELVRYSQDGITSIKDIEGRFREVEALVVHDLDRRIAFLNVLVISAPLSMRATSSCLPGASSRWTEVRVTVPSLDLAMT